MKKTLLALALAAATSMAVAGPSVYTGFDLDRNGSVDNREVTVGVKVPTALGTIDAAAIGNRFTTNSARDETGGFEIGYGNGLKAFGVNIDGRVAYGRKNNAVGGNVQYYSAGIEGSVPVTQRVSAFVGYRHRNTFDTAIEQAQNRYTAGLNYAVTKNVNARLGYAHTRQGGDRLHGMTAAVSYSF